MKYVWNPKPPKDVPSVAAAKSNVWPKPDASTLKYTQIGKLLIAIGRIKISGRWEVYIHEEVLVHKGAMYSIRKQWMAKSRKKGTHRPGYTNYGNAYRSIPKHISISGGPIR